MLRSCKTPAFLMICLVWVSQISFAQKPEYLFPINPGQQNYLSGTMGELRTSHFHGGIDIKTGGVEGLPVYAAQSGYISRIRVSGTGYGNALYLAHPITGTTTVYGHLQRFEKKIATYVRHNQYAEEQFQIELYPSKEEFRVEKGDVIGYSGNSGSSGGPHLHFEIRDAYQRPINPLKFNFTEIKDDIAPTIQKVALKTLDIDSRINGQFGRFEFTPYRSGNKYKINKTIEVNGEIGLQIMAYDRLNGASNRNGVSELILKVDSMNVLSITIDKIPFNKNRHILTFCEFETKQNKNQNYQKLYIDDGNALDIYSESINAGRLMVKDTSLHIVEVILKDAYGNKSTIELTLKGNVFTQGKNYHLAYFKPVPYRIMDNTLILTAQNTNPEQNIASVYANRMRYAVLPEYEVNNYQTILWDLRKGLPDSVRIEENTIYPKLEMTVPSKAKFAYFKEEMNLNFGPNTLFDTLYLRTNYMSDEAENREFFEIGDHIFPLNQSMWVSLKPKLPYPHPDKTSVYQTKNNNSYSYNSGKWMGKNYEFKTRDFGRYTLLTDTIPPSIRVIEQTQNQFRCYIKDNLSGIKSYRLSINNAWILLNYDPKRNYCWTEKEDSSTPFKGDLELKVIDNVNNERVYTTKIN